MLRQHFNEETERADILRDVLQCLQIGYCIGDWLAGRFDRYRLRKALHCSARVLHRTQRIVLFQDRQYTTNLMQYWIDVDQCIAFGGVIEVLVQQFLNLAQTGFHLTGQHHHALSLLRLARQVVKPWRRVLRCLTGGNRQQARGECIGPFREVVGQAMNLIQRIFNEQQAGRDLQAEAAVGPGVPRDAIQLAQ